MKDVDKGAEIEITEERFSELTTGPLGVFVEEIKDTPPVDPPKDVVGGNDATSPVDPPKEGTPSVDHPDVNYTKMTKAELVEYAESIEIELNMEMTKDEMIEILQQK